jgi:cysteine desulfurase/selenocysteine lyase
VTGPALSTATRAPAAPGAAAPPPFDVQAIRREFPSLSQLVHGKPLCYLDSANTNQKPKAVLEATERYYAQDCANVHRAVHTLAERATRDYEAARVAVQRFINAADPRECVFVRGTTEAINLVAHSFARPRLGPGDEVLVTALEHHSNIVPWQLACEATGAKLVAAPMNDAGELVWEEFVARLGPRTKLVAAIHASNALGTVNPVARIVEAAHARGVPVLLDGAQAAPHGPVDVRALGCDFYAFSSHKLFGPTGVGVLYGKLAHLESMPPWQGGGDMIRSVTFERSTYAPPPARFEAGTPNVAGVIGLGAALGWLGKLDWKGAQAHEQALLAHCHEALSKIAGVRIIGTAKEKVSVVSFVVEGCHAHDLATILDHEGVAVRAGHHCAQPIMDRFKVSATARASFSIFNTHDEVETLARGLVRVKELLA